MLLPEAQTATIDLRGGNVTAGAEGNIAWTLSFVDESPGASLRAVRSEGEGTTRIDVTMRYPQSPKASSPTAVRVARMTSNAASRPNDADA